MRVGVLALSLSVSLPALAAAGPSAAGHKGMVVAVSPPATAVGVEVLKKGGTAVDAAVAVALAQAVTWPEAGNIGGGGFMVVRPAGADSTPVVIDYRETAPAAAARDLYVKAKKTPHRVVGVPGTVAGLVLAHEKFGKLPWKALVEPSVRLAEEGFAVDEALAASLNSVGKTSDAFPEFVRLFVRAGGWKAGDRLVQKDLGRSLRAIAERGRDGFYKGEVADRIVAEMKAGGGLITHADLAGYRAKLREPIHGTYRGYDVYGPPPPSSGGVCLVQMLNVLENFDLKKEGRYSATTLHLLAETMRRAYCDRARHLGDQDFVAVPTHLTSKEYAKKLAASIDPRKATRSEDLAPELKLLPEKEDTTHFSVMDGAGMAVSNTYTLEDSFGSRVVVRGAGFILNDEMNDFNPTPGVTTRAGQVGTEANLIAPGKRMLSSQTPVILTKGGRVVLVTGSPGGRTIINTVLQVVLDVVEFERPLREAVDGPRLHQQWFPDRVQVEPDLATDHTAALKSLTALGHRLAPRPTRQGDAHSIVVDPKTGEYRGEADRRRGGSAAGY